MPHDPDDPRRLALQAALLAVAQLARRLPENEALAREASHTFMQALDRYVDARIAAAVSAAMRGEW